MDRHSACSTEVLVLTLSWAWLGLVTAGLHASRVGTILPHGGKNGRNHGKNHPGRKGFLPLKVEEMEEIPQKHLYVEISNFQYKNIFYRVVNYFNQLSYYIQCYYS